MVSILEDGGEAVDASAVRFGGESLSMGLDDALSPKRALRVRDRKHV